MGKSFPKWVAGAGMFSYLNAEDGAGSYSFCQNWNSQERPGTGVSWGIMAIAYEHGGCGGPLPGKGQS